MNRYRLFAVLLLITASAQAATIPSASGTTLDGHTVKLPRDLAPRATILILGFTEHSKETTTTWEKAVRSSLNGSGISYFDIPFLEDAPSFVRPLILHSIRKQVPDIVKPRFLPLTTGESAWKQAAQFTPTAPDAAYVLLVDNTGAILWQTHDPYSPALLSQLYTAARPLTPVSR